MYRKNRIIGFTLVEVIVVLVILAILAALLLPALTGWIDRARQKRLLVECRACVTAAQTLASETYATGGNNLTPPDALDIKKLAEVDGTVSAIEFMTGSPRIYHLTYSDGTDSVTYCALADDHPETYNFSAGLTVGQAAQEMSAAMGKVKEDRAGVSNKGEWNKTGIHFGVNNALSQAFLDKLPDNVEASLAGKTWSIYGNTNAILTSTTYKLYVYDGGIDGFKSGNSIDITVYDLSTGEVDPTIKQTVVQTNSGVKTLAKKTY